jgi:hypothetical protein
MKTGTPDSFLTSSLRVGVGSGRYIKSNEYGGYKCRFQQFMGTLI